jgi:hypothetical protein
MRCRLKGVAVSSPGSAVKIFEDFYCVPVSSALGAERTRRNNLCAVHARTLLILAYRALATG